ncbi:glycosyltransferase [Ravibacter arvi]|uniref:glycosyltransferase n=1 Tax=Ravibacter arvi TaxID=2051041 RepID=UPI003CD0BCB2
MDQINEFPLVSVILSVFDGEKYLRECLASIEASDYPHLELIIVNDYSFIR